MNSKFIIVLNHCFHQTYKVHTYHILIVYFINRNGTEGNDSKDVGSVMDSPITAWEDPSCSAAGPTKCNVNLVKRIEWSITDEISQEIRKAVDKYDWSVNPFPTILSDPFGKLNNICVSKHS